MKKIAFNNKTGFGGNLYAICTIVPNVYYSQGIEKDICDYTFFDKYNPEFANENFVGIPRKCLDIVPNETYKSPNSSGSAVSGTSTYKYNSSDLDVSVGRTTSWWNYQTDVNRSFSLLSKGQSMEGWLLNRNLKDKVVTYGTVESLDKVTGFQELFAETPYCFPHQFNYCFADTNPTAQNFIVQFAADINVRRVMPSYNQPKIF